MRIAHVSATFPPYQAGSGNACYNNARELARLGHEVVVITTSRPGAPSSEVCHDFQVHRLRPVLRIGNAPVLLQLLYMLSGFDIIHLHSPFITGAEITSLASSFQRTPLVVTYHNDLIRSGDWRDSVFAIATRSNRVVLRRAARVLFVSEGHARTCEQRSIYTEHRERCRVLPNGIDTGLFRPSLDRDSIRAELELPTGGKIIGFVGALDRAHRYKGLDVLFRAMTSAELEDACLLVIGDGQLKYNHEQEAVLSGIRPRVHFLGTVEQERLPFYYQACDAIAMPSRVPESFGLVAAEALACGIPVIATEFRGSHSLIKDGENGYLISPNNSVELAKTLNSTLSLSNEERREMGLIGRYQMEAAYDCRQIGRQLAEIYKDLLSRGVNTGQVSNEVNPTS